MRGELFFIATNVLLTTTDSSRPGYHENRTLFKKALEKGVHLCISGQIIREYLVVATRPVELNGLGLLSNDALHNVEVFRRRLAFFEESEMVSLRLLSLVREYSLTGKKIHDANIVALMCEQNIP